MPRIIALAGRIASGKSKAAQLLRDEFGMVHIEYSSFLYGAMDLFDITHSRKNIDTCSTFFRQTYAQDILARAVKKQLRQTKQSWVVLSTIRRLSDLDGVRDDYPVHLWYVEADQRVRYERHRLSARKEGDAQMSFEEFQMVEKNEVQSSIPLLKQVAELIIENNADIEIFFKNTRFNARKLLTASES